MGRRFELIKVKITNTSRYLKERATNDHDVILCFQYGNELSFAASYTRIIRGKDGETEEHEWEIDGAENGANCYLAGKGIVSSEELLEYVLSSDKEAFLWILFHPELFEGKYIRDGHDIED